MTDKELRALVIEEIGNIAPEADAGSLDDAADFREALDMDSMDVFNLVVALSQRTGIDIPDADVPRLASLGGAVAYLLAHGAKP